MFDAQTQTDQTRLQFIRSTLLSFCITLLFFIGLAIVLYLLAPGMGFVVFTGLLFLAGSGSGLSIYSLERSPAILAMLPCVITFMLAEIGIAVFLPELSRVAGTYLTFLVLTVSITGDRRFTQYVAIAAAILYMVMLSLPEFAGLSFTLGFGTQTIQVLGVGAIVILIWLIADRFTAAQVKVVGLAERRAADAEAARAQAEAARTEAEQHSAEQQRLLELVQTLELPVIPIGQGVLIAPLVGSIDSRRVAAIQRRLLEMVGQERAHTVVLDLTAIAVIDTSVARSLLMMAQAVRLLGARTLLSGISAEVAQTLVGLGIGLDEVQTVRNLGQALEFVQHN
jgi:rsbT co-antagonist protein RsbR